jgi:hypothetical protein
MENGEIDGTMTPSQLATVPMPENDSIYYVFYSDVGQLYSKLKYAIININANNGLGKVIAKEIALIDTAATELIDITLHCNGTDFWISSKQNDWTNGRYIYSWLLTSNGINPVPVVSDIATIYQQNPYWKQSAGGYLKFSPNGSIVAVDYLYENLNYAFDSSYIEIYHFDNCTGVFSNPITISYPYPYSLAFSPDNSKLYVGSIAEGDSNICYFSQFDISNYNQTDIINSKTILAQGGLMGTPNRLAIDGKIYVADLDTNLLNCGLNRLGVIHNPNAPGLSCNYVSEEIDLLGKMHGGGFICFTESYFSSFEYSECTTIEIENTGININNYIYPNPFYNILNIAIKEENLYLKVIIYDMLGHIVFDKTIKNDSQINISNLIKGIYFLKVFDVNNENLIFNKKIIKS